MVRDQELAVQDYAKLYINHLPSEKFIKIINKLVRNTEVLRYFPNESEAEKNNRSLFVEILEKEYWKKTKAAIPGSDEQKIWFDAYIGVAESKESLNRIVGLLDGKEKVSGLVIDQDRRWNSVAKLNMFSHPLAEPILKSETKKDMSERGQQSAISAEAVQPNIEVKKKWLDVLGSEKTNMSLARMNAVMRNLFPSTQEDLKWKFQERFFQTIPDMAVSRDPEFLTEYTEHIVPAVCSKQSVDSLNSFLSLKSSKLPPFITKPLKIAKQEDERCVAVRAKARNAKAQDPGPLF
jgi:aminopeptidase N